MSLCITCKNLLEKDTSGDKLKFKCSTCGDEYDSHGYDTLIYSADHKTFNYKKSGTTIFGYPSNQKIFLDCPSCKAKIVGWEEDHLQEKVYGCQCGYSWKQVKIDFGDSKS